MPTTTLDDAVDELLAELRASATVAVGLTKHCINGAAEGGVVAAMEQESMALELSSRTSDFREGLAAFRERRDPRYEGR